VITSSWKQHRYTQKYGSVVPCTRTALVSRTRRPECRQQSDVDEDHNLQSTTVERRRVSKISIEVNFCGKTLCLKNGHSCFLHNSQNKRLRDASCH